MRLVLPSPAPTGIRELLLVSGVSRAGNIVYIHYLGGGEIRLGIDHSGTPGMESRPIRVPFGGEHILQIAMGALFPSAANGPPPQHLRVLLDGDAVIDAEQDTYASSPYDVTVGANAIGGSTCAYAFTGKILRVERVPPPP